MSKHKGIFKNSEIENISSRLKFIGTLKPKQKINVSRKSIQDPTYWNSLVRSVTGESRQRVYNFISDTIHDALSVLDSLGNSKSDSDVQVCRNLITDLIYLNPGLANLQQTYKSDRMYVSKIITLMENLEVKLRELCQKQLIDYDEKLVEAQDQMKELLESSELTEETTVELPVTPDHMEVDEKKTTPRSEPTNLNASSSSTTKPNPESAKPETTSAKPESSANSTSPPETRPPLPPKPSQKPSADNEMRGTIEEMMTSKKKTVTTEVEESSSTENSSKPSPIPEEELNQLVANINKKIDEEKYKREQRELFRAKYLKPIPPNDVILMSAGGNNMKRRRKPKNVYEYDDCYVSSQDQINDITLNNAELGKGLIRKQV